MIGAMAEISIWIRVGGGALVIVLLGWFYFILMGSGKKGKFGIITLGLVGLFIYHPVFEILALVLLVGLIAGIKIRLNFHKGEYEIAAARMEGGGIKRGLLASEAAVLLGKPFEIAMAASIVSLLKRGVLYTNTINQMIIGVESGFRVEGTGAKFDEREEIRMKSALKRNVVLFPHELLFLELLEGHAEKPLNTIELDIIIRPLIKLLVERLGGYDIEQSRQYYSKVVERASFEARSDGSLTKDVYKVVDQNLEWIMLQDNPVKFLRQHAE
ncbi:MAG: hypothetical protein OEZ02_09985, partial [Anaerolineae bacterium]|nr:hypothetical protein [Anaerolineae bacterium]